MKLQQYILDDNDNPKICHDVLIWAKWIGQAWPQRRICQTQIGNHFVSTVFLGLDHNSGRKGDPILYETMVFSNYFEEFKEIEEEWEDRSMWRYRTKQEALQMHHEIVKALEKAYQRAGNKVEAKEVVEIQET